MRVVHLTSVHKRYDTRIFLKQCISLSKKYDVSLVVADGNDDEIKGGIKIFDIGKPTGRLNRILFVTRRVYAKAVELDADIYHAHDPELLPVLLKLKRKGKTVIFDSHEDFPKQLLSKPYLNLWFSNALACFSSFYEKNVCKKLCGIVAATPYIKQKFLKINPNTVAVNNYPILREFLFNELCWKKKKTKVCYVGGLSKVRGISEIIAAIEQVGDDVELMIGGNFGDDNYKKEIESLDCSRVTFMGFLDRESIKSLYGNSIAGLVSLHPIPNYLDALPVKMFEYMAAGIPVIASNFPLWREIIESGECGICVDPLDSKSIASAIDYLVNNPSIAKTMGANGRKLVEEKYNWANEEMTLFSLYEQLFFAHNNDKPLNLH